MFYKFDKSSKHFKSLRFVALAVSKDPAKYEINYIYCGDDDIVATDGHRCHIYTPDSLPIEPGRYEVVKITKTALHLNTVSPETAETYPDYKRILPKPDGAEEFSRHKGKYLGKDSQLAQVLRALPAPTCLDCSYFFDIITNQEMAFFKVGDGTSPVLFLGDKVKAVLMPKRL